MRFLYALSLAAYRAGIGLAAIWNPKAKKWINGRTGWAAALELALADAPPQRVWIHCASLGEFEQGRPVIEALRKEHPNLYIVLSFFSPSGYEIRKNYAGANYVCYLPMDSAHHAKRFVQTLSPKLAIFVKYEFWHHYLHELKRSGVSTLLISAIFRPSQPFFKPWGGFWRRMLGCYKEIFVQDQSSWQLLSNCGFGAMTVISGDTRFDRVTAIARDQEDIPLIRQYCAGHRVIVAGSTWPEDEEILNHYAKQHPEIRFIIAPHEIHEGHIHDIEKLFPESMRFSKVAKMHAPDGLPHVLIMDNMGMLSRLYAYADITYIGGGFGGAGIHNVLEAAVYGKPVLFGPVHEKSREARELVAAGGAFVVMDAVDAEQLLDELWLNKTSLENAGKIAGSYVQNHCGATEIILHYIHENRLLTN